MKKIMFFLTTIMIALICSINVNASTTFYEGEYIDNIYMIKQKAAASTVYYQKARFFRQTGTNRFAYCVDPFSFFQDGSIYEETITPSNLNANQKEQISLIAYFGYGYKGHTDPKWYAITQFMIWKAAYPTGSFHFTNGLNGPIITAYTNEMNEINSLINNYKKQTSLNNKTYTLLEGESLFVTDTNSVLSNYKSSNPNFVITGNTLTASNLTEGVYQIDLIREENYHNTPLIFYQAANSQALMQTGNLSNKQEHLQVEVIKTEIEITKIDKDTQSITPSGQGSLIGAEYGLYNEQGELVQTIVINEDSTGKVENIPFGKYYLQETKAPTGYKLSNEKHEFEITKENSKLNLTIENEIIKKKITIYKTYDENERIPEANISFTVYDNKNNKVATITTDENGKAEITLPYGEYKIVQENTTEGYHKVEDILLTVEDIEDEIITLTDYKIAVPETSTNIFMTIITIILRIFNL